MTEPPRSHSDTTYLLNSLMSHMDVVDYELLSTAINIALSSGNLGMLISLAEISSDLVAKQLSLHEGLPDELFKAISLNPEEGVHLYCMVRWSLNLRTRRLFRSVLSKLLVRQAAGLISNAFRTMSDHGAPTKVDYAPGLDFDIEETIEALLSKSKRLDEITYEDIVALERRREKKRAVLLLDSSGSMSGKKMAIASVLTAAVAYLLRGSDYSVILFNSKAEILHPLGRRSSSTHLVERILDVVPMGYTNMREALLLAKHQAKDYKNVKYILVTDGKYNVGGDPSDIAKKMNNLNVVSVSRGDAPMSCVRLARLGGGKCYTIHSVKDVPEVVSQILK